MATKLTKKQKTFVKEYAKTGNGVQAALKSYDTEDYATAGVIAVENLEKPKIQNALQEALPDELLINVHREGLFATKPNFRETEDGLYENVGDEPDYAVRHKYLDTAYKVKGSYAPEKHIVASLEAQISQEDKELATKLMSLERDNG